MVQGGLDVSEQPQADGEGTGAAGEPEVRQETVQTVNETVEFEVVPQDAANVENFAPVEVQDNTAYAANVQSVAGTDGGAAEALQSRVLTLKERLMDLGYMQKDVLTGNYDPYTQLGVMFFQRDNDLTVTGIADDDTMAALLAEDAQSYLLTEGMEGEDVRQLQSSLLSLGLDVEATGKFGGATVNAVKAFQRARGAEETGKVDALLRKVIMDEAAINGQFIIDESIAQSGASTVVEKLIQSAYVQLGKPYILGAKGPNSFDCSGLVYYCLNQAGYKIDYMTSGGWAASSYETVNGMANLRRGDIICFRGHVGIYLGNGQMLDASSSEGKVRVTDNIDQKDYWVTNFLYGKRVLK